MSINWPSAGEYSSTSYQISALPYVSSSIIMPGEIHKYEFDYVTKFIRVTNQGTNVDDKLAIGFTERGLSTNVNNYISLLQGNSIREEIRTTTLYVSCSNGTNVNYQLFCGLTNIPSKHFLQITGSNGHQGVG